MISVDGSWVTGAEVQAVSLVARNTFVDLWNGLNGVSTKFIILLPQNLYLGCLYRGEMKRGCRGSP